MHLLIHCSVHNKGLRLLPVALGFRPIRRIETRLMYVIQLLHHQASMAAIVDNDQSRWVHTSCRVPNSKCGWENKNTTKYLFEMLGGGNSSDRSHSCFSTNNGDVSSWITEIYFLYEKIAMNVTTDPSVLSASSIHSCSCILQRVSASKCILNIEARSINSGNGK